MMKHFNKIVQLLATAFMLMLISQSCVNDDLSDCPKGTRVYFTYKTASTDSTGIREGINPADIDKIDVYIFDENGIYVGKMEDEGLTMSLEYNMLTPELKTGKYTFVAWGNLEDQYSLSSEKLIAGETSINDLYVSLNSIVNSMVTDSLKPLFYATHADHYIDVDNRGDGKVLLNLVEDIHKINVTVEGLNKDTLSNSKNTYRLEIVDNNGNYDFSSDFAPCENFTYLRSFEKNINNASLSSSVTVMRLAKDRSPKLRVVNNETGAVIVEEDLVQLIMNLEIGKDKKIDFENQYEFNIRFVLDADAQTIIEIYINGWRYIPINVEGL